MDTEFEDELNMDPRETDYLDHIDMDKAINFYELKLQLEAIGMNDPQAINQLRQVIAGEEDRPELNVSRDYGHYYESFIYNLVRQPDGQLVPTNYDAGIIRTHDQSGRELTKAEFLSGSHYVTLEPQVPVEAAFRLAKLLQERPDTFTDEEVMTPVGYDRIFELLARTAVSVDTRQLDQLQKQVVALEFYERPLLDDLHEMMNSKKIEHALVTKEQGVDFTLFYNRDGDKFNLYCIDASMDIPGKVNNQVMQYFLSDVPVTTAVELLQLNLKVNDRDHDPFLPLNQQQTQEYIHLLKSKTMNDQNLSYLQKQLLNLGFGDKVNAELEQKIKNQEKEFTLNTSQEYNKTNMDYTLHYKAGDKEEMYFFNKYDAKLKDEQQTFYLNNGSGITAKEAFNLMEGRAVHKELENKAGEKYKAWVVLDKDNKTDNGNAKLQTYSDGWNYKPERAIDKMDIVGINDAGARDKLMKSLEKGNRHQVEAMKNGKPVQLFIEANPAEHRVNLTNYKGEAQRLEDYKKPEAKQEQKKDESQKQTLEHSKKKSRTAKMKV
jgi:hypothetical protein